MGEAQTLLLGFIAGVTILLGLPLGRLRSPVPGTRVFLNAVAVGILVFLTRLESRFEQHVTEPAGHLDPHHAVVGSPPPDGGLRRETRDGVRHRTGAPELDSHHLPPLLDRAVGGSGRSWCNAPRASRRTVTPGRARPRSL